MKDTSGPAFPLSTKGEYYELGMSRRDLIATHVMAGIRASETDYSHIRMDSEYVAKMAREDADALLKELDN